MQPVALPSNITKYLDTRDQVARLRLLTTMLVPHTTNTILADGTPAGCLVGVAAGAAEMVNGWQRQWIGVLRENPRRVDDWIEFDDPITGEHIAHSFNELSRRNQQGTQRAIRDYILAKEWDEAIEFDRGLTQAEEFLQAVEASEPEPVSV